MITQKEQLKTIVREFQSLKYTTPDIDLSLMRLGAQRLLDQCNREISIRQDLQWWTIDGVTRVLQPRDDGFRVGEGARVEQIKDW